ncbi:hypothetical protein ACHAWO_004856 [Cyclotella atomus]|uniref:Conserved Oligomeric Golgi complex subunit 6 C-terminal domain-containing protein n=1 Tax=Cyclotella atomus TaxID=382360 RepID=A0ABD3PMY5_9STRA
MSDNILSAKVARALSVRTDTPAMLSALEALAGLESDGDAAAGGDANNNKSTTPVIDPRSIRSTIEQSALLRAMAFQSQLQKLSDAATKLRERAEDVERCAEVLERRSVGGVVVVDFAEDGISASTPTVVVGGGGGEEEAWKKEQMLATKLYQAHRSYLNSTKRRIAVEAFLEKFDLSEEETRLLDTFEFQGSQEHSMAFLSALERLAVIRRELGKTFGKGGVADDSIMMDETKEEIEEEYSSSSSDIMEQRRIGTHSALRMMEQLATRQERAHERLYQFIQTHLGIGMASPARNVPTSSDAMRGGRQLSDPLMYRDGNNLLGRFIDGDDMDEAYANIVLRRALYVLRNSRERHVHALEMIASSRRTEVTRRFLLALTNGYGGMAPLEMRAHDPVGYVGDMLAFAFRSFRVEGELVKTLFVWEDDYDNRDEAGAAAAAEAKSNVEDNTDEDGDETKEENEEVSKPMNVLELLSQSMGGLARPLGTRIKQVIKSLESQRQMMEEQVEDVQGDYLMDARSKMMMESGTNDDEDVATSSMNQIVCLFTICGLLKFYSSAVQNALDKFELMKSNDDFVVGESAKNPFFTTCVESLIEASESYVASLRTYGALLSSNSSPDTTEAMLAQRLIVRIAEERVASPGFADDSSLPEINVSMKQLSLTFLVSTLVDAAIPYLKSLDDGAALKAAMTSTVKCGLESAEAEKWIDLIEEKEAELVEALVDAESEKVLAVCGLGGIRAALQQMNAVYVEGMTMSSHPGLSQADIEAAMKQFYSSLYSPPISTFEDSIKDPELRKVARSKTAKRVVDEYKSLYQAITSEKGGYADVSFLGHDPDQVNTLLSL